ncbi:hypothetical protein KIPB_015459, partial [Kipferlia bialata]
SLYLSCDTDKEVPLDLPLCSLAPAQDRMSTVKMTARVVKNAEEEAERQREAGEYTVCGDGEVLVFPRPILEEIVRVPGLDLDPSTVAVCGSPEAGAMLSTTLLTKGHNTVVAAIHD